MPLPSTRLLAPARPSRDFFGARVARTPIVPPKPGAHTTLPPEPLCCTVCLEFVRDVIDMSGNRVTRSSRVCTSKMTRERGHSAVTEQVEEHIALKRYIMETKHGARSRKGTAGDSLAEGRLTRENTPAGNKLAPSRGQRKAGAARGAGREAKELQGGEDKI